MAINHVIYGGKTLIDLTEDSVTSESLLIGRTAHDRSGNIVFGTLPVANLTVDEEGNMSFGFIVEPDGSGILSCRYFEVDSDGNATAI